MEGEAETTDLAARRAVLRNIAENSGIYREEGNEGRLMFLVDCDGGVCVCVCCLEEGCLMVGSGWYDCEVSL